MYGINSTYWFSFLDANRGSVLFDVLKRLNYNINIISATNTRWPEFRKTCYVDILNSIKDNHKGAPWQLDIQSKGEFMQLINKYDDNKSIFSFVFLDGPHGYSYPKEFNKFNANGENINYLTAREGSKEIKQAKLRYKNAIYHDDKLLGDMLAKLKEKGLYDDSLIIFTSDHGQEFYEYGFLGHNSAFSRAQTNTPMIIKLPKSLKNKLTIEDTKHFTSHIDIVPTLLSILGVQNKTSDYSNGYSLFDKDYVSKREYVCCANWTTNAIITPEKIYQFTNEPDTMFNNMVRSTIDYKPIKGAKVDNSLIIKVMNENKQFMK
jgi:membrane-anchored protein YejM (alkaline phosphatase superfamily)